MTPAPTPTPAARDIAEIETDIAAHAAYAKTDAYFYGSPETIQRWSVHGDRLAAELRAAQRTTPTPGAAP